MDKSWINKHRLSPEYINGVKNFLDFAFGKIKVDELKCPCNHCCLSKSKLRQEIEGDLMCFGFLNSYTEWELHGEEITTSETTIETQPAQVESNSTVDLLNDLFPGIINMDTFDGSGPSEHPTNDTFAGPSSSDHPTNTDNPSNTNDESSFDALLADYNQELYPGCTKFSKLSFILKLYHIKCLCGISDKGISMVLQLLKEAFENAKLPDSFSDMKKVIRKLGLTYESIHACPNDCMLYWEENAHRDTCKICEASRWKARKSENTEASTSLASKSAETEASTSKGSKSASSEASRVKKKTKLIPAKVLRYFPLKPRLQRLFMSSKTASDMRWHACGRKSYARKRRDMKKKSGKTPSRAELFIASRKKSNGSFVSEEAKSRVDELTHLMSQNPSDERSNNITASLDDEFSKMFGPERPGRVRCVGRGPTPSKLPKHSTAGIDTSNSEVVELRSTVSSLENTVQSLVGIAQELVDASSVQTTGLVPNLSTVLSNLANQPNFAAILSNFRNQSNSQHTESDEMGNQNTSGS